MNVFYLHKDFRQCARWHNDKHTVKMILEYCQLLSTAHRFLDGKLRTEKNEKGRKVSRWVLADQRLNKTLYKATHINHPCGVWVRASSANYIFLYNLCCELVKEYKLRYAKPSHKSEAVLVLLATPPALLPNGLFTEPPKAMPDKYKKGDSVEAYRRLYTYGKFHLSDWKAHKPRWYPVNVTQRVVSLGLRKSILSPKAYWPKNGGWKHLKTGSFR